MIQQGVSALQIAYLNLPAVQSGAWMAFLITAIAAAFIWLYRSGKAGPGILILIILLPVIHGMRFNSKFIGVVDPSQQWGANPVTDYLTGLPGNNRVFNFEVLPPNLLPHFDVPVVVGYHGNQPRWFEQLIGGIPKVNLRNPRFLNAVSADYIVAPKEYQLERAKLGPEPLRQVRDFGRIGVYQNPNALPRVYLVDRYVVASDKEDLYKGVLGGDSDLRRVVFLEKEPELPIIADTMSRISDSTWIIDYDVNTISIGLHSSTNKLLVLTDNYYDAWQATVDGAPAEVLLANGSFRAVAVPAGTQRLEYNFHSARYQTGKWVTLLTSLYALVAIGLGVFFQRRYKTDDNGQVT